MQATILFSSVFTVYLFVKPCMDIETFPLIAIAKHNGGVGSFRWKRGKDGKYIAEEASQLSSVLDSSTYH